MNFAKAIRKIRYDHNLTQKDLAKELNVARTTLNSWENGLSVPSDELKILIAKKYKISMNYLFGLPEQNNNKYKNINSKINQLTIEEIQIIEPIINLILKTK